MLKKNLLDTIKRQHYFFSKGDNISPLFLELEGEKKNEEHMTLFLNVCYYETRPSSMKIITTYEKCVPWEFMFLDEKGMVLFNRTTSKLKLEIKLWVISLTPVKIITTGHEPYIHHIMQTTVGGLR